MPEAPDPLQGTKRAASREGRQGVSTWPHNTLLAALGLSRDRHRLSYDRCWDDLIAFALRDNLGAGVATTEARSLAAFPSGRAPLSGVGRGMMVLSAVPVSRRLAGEFATSGPERRAA